MADVYGARIPARPDVSTKFDVDEGGATQVATGNGVISIMSSSGESARIVTIDALTRKTVWSAPTGNDAFLLGSGSGPGDANGALIVAADNVAVPQEGLTPASTRIDIIARDAVDGTERWRVEVARDPVDSEDPEELLALKIRSDAVVALTSTTLRVLESATGRERWKSKLKLSPIEERPEGEGWISAALGPAEVVATARLTDLTGQLVTFDLATGKRRWRVVADAPLELAPTSAFGQVEAGAGRVLTNAFTTDEQAGTRQTLRGYDLAKGKLLWRSPVSDSSEDIPFTIDQADGTALRTLDSRVAAFNIQSGAVRWKQPTGVSSEEVVAGDRVTYLIGTSGEDRQVISLDSRTGEQLAVLPGIDAVHVRPFAGGVAVLNANEVSIFR